MLGHDSSEDSVPETPSTAIRLPPVISDIASEPRRRRGPRVQADAGAVGVGAAHLDDQSVGTSIVQPRSVDYAILALPPRFINRTAGRGKTSSVAP